MIQQCSIAIRKWIGVSVQSPPSSTRGIARPGRNAQFARGHPDDATLRGNWRSAHRSETVVLWEGHKLRR
jgi:hypothetical protein